MSDNLFETIPRVLQTQIDAAFTQTYNDHFNPNDNPIASTSGSGGFLPPSPPAGGGFLPPTPPAGGGFLPPSPPTAGGGFLIDDDDAVLPAPAAEPTHLPLRLVPHALQRLDLPPDDSEVLGILANAAGGWQTPHTRPRSTLPSDTDEQWVARADWREVCAVLLEGRDDDDDAEGPRSSSPGRSSLGAADDTDADVDIDMSSLSDPSADDGASSDEFRLAPSPRAPKSKSRPKGKARASTSPPPARRTRRSAPISNTNTTTAPSERQRTAALAAFALFFPDLTPDAPDLPTRRIRVAELQRAAGVLREKIKAEEVRVLAAPSLGVVWCEI